MDRRVLLGLAVLLVTGCGSYPEHLLNHDASTADKAVAGDQILTSDLIPDQASDLTLDQGPECKTPGKVCSSSCKDPLTALVKICTADKKCGPEKKQTCEPFKCNQATGACLKSCNSVADCSSALYECAAGWCLEKGGQKCTSGKTCASGYCVDGVCCDDACNKTCESCVEKGNVGKCTPIADGADPFGECSDLGSAACKTDGSCDGLGACRLYPKGAVCGTKQCVGGSLQDSQCDGSGACQLVTVDCFPHKCSSAACFTSCTSSNESKNCASNMECDTSAGKCKSTCKDYGDCQGYWNCDTSTKKCYTTCTSSSHCRPGGDYYCSSSSHTCKKSD